MCIREIARQEIQPNWWCSHMHKGSTLKICSPFLGLMIMCFRVLVIKSWPRVMLTDRYNFWEDVRGPVRSPGPCWGHRWGPGQNFLLLLPPFPPFSSFIYSSSSVSSIFFFLLPVPLSTLFLFHHALLHVMILLKLLFLTSVPRCFYLDSYSSPISTPSSGFNFFPSSSSIFLISKFFI